MIEGEMVVRWKENGLEKEEIIRSGDLVENGKTPHTFENRTDKTVKFIVIKQVLSGQDKRDVLKRDKVID